MPLLFSEWRHNHLETTIEKSIETCIYYIGFNLEGVLSKWLF